VVEHLAAKGGIDEIPLPAGVGGRLWACGFSVVGPDPERALALTGATTLVCLLERDEIDRRFPGYGDWLADSGEYDAWWFPIEDHDVVDDATMAGWVDDVVQVLLDGDGVIVHCGAGLGRAGILAALVLCRLGSAVDAALATVRASRPGAGPQSHAQLTQVRRLGAAG